MGEIKEDISITQIHDNDKFIVTRSLKEELTGEELTKAYNEILAGLEEIKRQIEDIPNQEEQRTKVLTQQLEEAQKQIDDTPKIVEQRRDGLVKQLELIQDRAIVFARYAKQPEDKQADNQ